jgi:ribosomal protein L27
LGRDHTIFATAAGYVQFEGHKRKYVSVLPAQGG